MTTAREPVIVLPKCSIFRDAGMQIKCQLGGEEMKHWQYEVLKSLNWERRVCVSGNSGGVLRSAQEIYSISDLSGLFRPIFQDNLICVS